MADYEDLTRRIAELSHPGKVVYAACCAARYVPVLTLLAPHLEASARAYIDLLTDSLGRINRDQAAEAASRVDALMPTCGDASQPEYWAMGAFSLVEYALQCARDPDTDNPPNWVCGEAVNLAAGIDYHIAEAGLTPRLEHLEIAAQTSSIRQLQEPFNTDTVTRLKTEAAAVAAEVEAALPTFQRSLTG